MFASNSKTISGRPLTLLTSRSAFDETIVCTVVDDSNKKNGEYYVTNGSTKFKVYSDTDKYRNNNQVRV